MFGSKATAALMKLKEIDRKYRIKHDDEKQHRSLSISELSSIEQQHGEILSQSQGITGSGDRPDSSARIKLNIQMPDTRMEPNDVARSSLVYQPDARRPEMFAISKDTEHRYQISKSLVEEDSSHHGEFPEDRAAVGPAGEGTTSDTVEMIISREDSENHTIDRDASMVESVAESLRQISSHFDEISRQQISAKSHSSIPTEVVIPPTAAPSDYETSYSEDFMNSSSSGAAEILETEKKSTNSKISAKNGSDRETGVESRQESLVKAQSPDPYTSPKRNSTGSNEVLPLDKKIAPEREESSSRGIEAAFEDIHSPKWVSKSKASSDRSTKLRSTDRKSGTTPSRDKWSRVKYSLSDSEDERKTNVATVSDSQRSERTRKKIPRKSSRRTSTSSSTGEIAVPQPSKRVTKIETTKTCNVEKSTVTSKCEHPVRLASYWQDEIVRLVIGRLKAEVPTAHASRKTPSKRVSKSAKKRTRHNACLIGPLQASAINNCQIYRSSAIQYLPATIAAPVIRIEGNPLTPEKPKATKSTKTRAKHSKSTNCSSAQKRRSYRAKNEKTTRPKSNRLQRQKYFAKGNKESFRSRNENQDLERRRVRGLRDQREQERLRSSVREHVRILIEEHQGLSVWPEIPVTFARRDDFCDGASRERRCFKPLDLPNVVAFERSGKLVSYELEDEVIEPTSRSLTAIRQRVLEIRHRLKDQFALYRDYSDFVSIVNSKYKPVTLKETKKIIRDMRRSSNNVRQSRVAAARDDRVYCQ